MKREVLLIDGRNFCYRHAYTRSQLFSKKRPTGAIFGCLSGLIRLHRYFPDAAIVFCWDGDKAKESWRHKLAPDYKGTRNKPDSEIPQEVHWIRQQIPIITEFIHNFGFRNFAVPCLEADDLIGILASNLKDKYDKIIIYSTDKDFYQLIKDPICVVRDLDKTKHCEEVTAKEIKKQHKVPLRNWLHFRSLVGEKTDNIAKPIAGVGPAKAMKMIASGVDPSKKKPHPDFKQHWKAIRLCYKLTKIVRKADDKRVPSITQKALSKILMEARAGRLYRLESSKSKKGYEYMLKFLQEYELQDIIERRDQLWKIK
jgi:5'-3' exonuclease